MTLSSPSSELLHSVNSSLEHEKRQLESRRKQILDSSKDEVYTSEQVAELDASNARLAEIEQRQTELQPQLAQCGPCPSAYVQTVGSALHDIGSSIT